MLVFESDVNVRERCLNYITNTHTHTATMYVFIGFISVATLYSGQMFSKPCDSQDSKPLLQRLNDDDYDDGDMVLGDDDRKLSADDVAIL